MRWKLGLAAAAVGAIVLIPATLVLGSYFAEFGPQLPKDAAVWGQLGDYIGGTLNPIFSFLSFIALIYTLLLQHQQLRLSREELTLSRAELEATREELKRTADSQAEASTYLRLQASFAALAARISATSGALDATDRKLDKLRASSEKSNLWIEREISALEGLRDSLYNKLAVLVAQADT